MAFTIYTTVEEASSFQILKDSVMRAVNDFMSFK